MPANYVLIQEITLNASAASVTFSSIPQTGYTDLVIKGSVRTTNASTYGGVDLIFNGSTSGYSSRNLEGGDGTAASYSTSGASSIKAGYVSGNNATANTFGTFEVYIPNYTSSNNKSVSVDSAGETNAANGIYMNLFANLWANSAAITSMTLSSNNLAAGSTFSLYGIAAVGTTPTVVPKASGGDIVVNDGTYWYHAFLSSGTFIPNTNLTANCLVVAGGGGASGGGGGAGGLVYGTQSLINATNYICTIGSGGTGAASGGSPSVNGGNGVNSSFGSITATGGGGGGGINNSGAAGTGGSGGGAGAISGTAGLASPSGQGNNGGSIAGFTGANYPSAGGGGAGAVGGNPTSNNAAGAGGAGLNTYSSWATATGTGASGYFAGGGGGGMYNLTGASPGSGGAGGGGTGGASGGSSPVKGTDGTANTGGGGGGSNSSPQANGGSGIVIIRYAMA